MFLIVVDSHSKWLEVVPMSSTSTEKTLDALRSLFASYGLLEQLVSDMGLGLHLLSLRRACE